MLVLTRKVGEEIVISSLNVSVVVRSVHGRRVRLAVSAPPEIPVHREEVWTRDRRDNPYPQPCVEELPVQGIRVLLAGWNCVAWWPIEPSRSNPDGRPQRQGSQCMGLFRFGLFCM